MSLEIGTEDVTGSSGMGEQMVNRDLGSHFLVGIINKELLHRIGQVKPTCLDQLQNCDGSEHFVHGPDAETSFDGVGRLRRPIGKSTGFSDKEDPVFGSENNAGELPIPGFTVYL